MKKQYGMLSFLGCSILVSTSLAVDLSCLSFMKGFIQSGDLVFDVGAHIGNKAEVYLAAGARVVCIEPQPNCCEVLRKKFKENDRVAIVQKGLADERGYLIMSICSGATTLSTFSSDWIEESRFSDQYHWDKQIEVEMITLDDVIKQFGIPSFCKIDVENFEYQVLRGLSCPIPYLSFEFAIESIHNTEKCVALLSSLGYQYFNVALGEIPRLKFDRWMGASEIIKTIKSIKGTEQLLSGPLWGDLYAAYNDPSK